MDRLVKLALGCAVWMALCSGAQAELIDSVRKGDMAYLVSESHLYLYDSSNGGVSTAVLDNSPLAIVAGDDGVFVAYPNRVEKRDLSGDIFSDGGVAITRTFSQITDIAINGNQLYVSFSDGNALHELSTADLSDSGSFYELSEPLGRLLPIANGAALERLLSPSDKKMLALEWPPIPDAEGIVEVVSNEMASGDSYVESADDLYLLALPGGDRVVMDNGTYWDNAGVYLGGWIAGQELRFLDQADDGVATVIRDKVVACESGDRLNWGSDLVNYETSLGFLSRNKLGAADTLYEIAHVWGAPSVAHVFREKAPGALEILTRARSEGEPFDDAKPAFSVQASTSVSGYQLSNGVSNQHVVFNEELSRAYVLHQGEERCQAAIRVYDLDNNAWVDSIPLRWRPEAIALVGGDDPDSSVDDQLAVVYETSFNAYGRSQMLATYIDINAPIPAEDSSRDFADYGVLFSDVSVVEAGRHAVLFQMETEIEPGYSIITALGIDGTDFWYADVDPDSGDYRTIDAWQLRSLGGGNGRIALKAGDDLRLMNFTESSTDFVFDVPSITSTLVDSAKDIIGPVLLSPDAQLFTLNLSEEAALFSLSHPSFSEGKPSDYLPNVMDAAAWSETPQGGTGEYALYNLIGGDVEGTAAAKIQRWILDVGADGHSRFEAAGNANVAGMPVRVQVVDRSTDDLMLATVYKGQLRFTPVNQDLSNAPAFEPDAGGDDSGNGNSDGGGGGAVSGSGFSSGGGGGSITWLFGALLLLVGVRRFR